MSVVLRCAFIPFSFYQADTPDAALRHSQPFWSDAVPVRIGLWIRKYVLDGLYLHIPVPLLAPRGWENQVRPVVDLTRQTCRTHDAPAVWFAYSSDRMPEDRDEWFFTLRSAEI
jgi:hypothetical protein